MKELCEARAKLETSSNFQIYLGKMDDEPPQYQTFMTTELSRSNF